MGRRKTPLATVLAQLPAARARYAREHKAGRHATSASYHRATGRIMLDLSNGFLFGFPVKSIPALADATARQLAEVEVSPGGTSLRWKELDADLSVAGLLLAAVGRSEKLSELARIAGESRTPAKAAASRANGAKGGRPRKRATR